MTQPQPQPNQPVQNRQATEPPRIAVHFELQPGPDGQPWVKCTIQVGLSSFAFIVTEHQAEQLAPLIGGGFAEGAAAARRERIGLILPGQDANGHQLAGVRPT